MRIAIASGKGGTGKTLVSTNLFWSAQEAGVPVTLVDCDAEEPNVTEFVTGDLTCSKQVEQKVPVIDSDVCHFCGKCFEYCNYNAIVYLPTERFIRVVEDLCHDCGACSVACRYGAITERPKLLGFAKQMSMNGNAELVEARAEVGVYSPVAVIREAIGQADSRYLAIYDSPPGISCPFIATVDLADYVVLVTEPTPFGLNDLKLSVETLQGMSKPFGVIINRAGLGDRVMYEWLEQQQIQLLLEIPFDREIARIYSEGKILAEEQPQYRALFTDLIKRIENQRKEWQR